MIVVFGGAKSNTLFTHTRPLHEVRKRQEPLVQSPGHDTGIHLALGIDYATITRFKAIYINNGSS